MLSWWFAWVIVWFCENRFCVFSCWVCSQQGVFSGSKCQTFPRVTLVDSSPTVCFRTFLSFNKKKKNKSPAFNFAPTQVVSKFVIWILYMALMRKATFDKITGASQGKSLGSSFCSCCCFLLMLWLLLFCFCFLHLNTKRNAQNRNCDSI